MDNKYYITTPIYYTNGKLHLGHCYTTVLADAIARYRRMSGYDVYFLTGSDEHGQKVEREAIKQNMQPKQYIDNMVAKTKELWQLLGISYDKFIRTTDEQHKQAVTKIFTKLYNQGDIYKSSYEGLYCVGCEAFYTDTQAVDGKCPECGRELEMAKEESYFFKLSKYQQKIEELFKKDGFFAFEKTKNEMYNNFLKDGLEDLCVTRSSFKWGIPVEFDLEHIVYVWIDALTNYITALGYMSDDETLFNKYWPADLHLMAKEITRFHTIIWPAILMALDLPMPKRVHAHGWLTQSGTKMGKSLGNGFDPYTLVQRVGVDALRYYLLKEGPLTGDAPYSTENFLAVINKDLANMVGNLLSRTTAMSMQNFEGMIPAERESAVEDDDILIAIKSLKARYTKYMDDNELKQAIESVISLVDMGNKYIENTEPWRLAKEGKTGRVAMILYTLTEVLRNVAIALECMIPDTSAKIFSALGIVDAAEMVLVSMGYIADRVGNQIIKQNGLFPRLNIADELKAIQG